MYRHAERSVQPPTVRSDQNFGSQRVNGYQAQLYRDYPQDGPANNADHAFNWNSPFLNTPQPQESDSRYRQPYYQLPAQRAGYLGPPAPHGWQGRRSSVYREEPGQYPEPSQWQQWQPQATLPQPIPSRNSPASVIMSPQLQPQAAPSPAVIRPVRNGRRARNRARGQNNNNAARENDKKLLSRDKYNKEIQKIRNKFCQRKNRQTKVAEIKAAKDKEEIYARIRGVTTGNERVNERDDAGYIHQLAHNMRAENNRRDENMSELQNLRQEVSLFWELDRCTRLVDANLAQEIQRIETTTDEMREVELDNFRNEYTSDANGHEGDNARLSNEDSDGNEDEDEDV